MLANRQRSPRVIYVAGSAREFPPEVRDWLSEGQHRAVAAPNVYDALARLTGRHRPAAVIVSIESVDWEEMEFFDLARRLSRQTTLYVSGAEHQEDKLAAALARGAQRFEEGSVDEDLARHTGIQETDDGECSKPVGQPGAPRPESGRLSLVHGLRTSAPLPPSAGEPMDAASRQRAVFVEITEEDEESLASGDETLPAEPAGVRLVAEPETASQELSESAVDGDEQPIPFPWAPSRQRPQRTPPPANRREPPAGETARSVEPAPEAQMTGAPDRASAASTVELTAEELAALMGKPGRAHAPPRPGGTS